MTTLMRLIIAGPEISQENLSLRGLDIIRPPVGIITERISSTTYITSCLKILKEGIFP